MLTSATIFNEDHAAERLIPPGELIITNAVTGEQTPEAAQQSFRDYGVRQATDWIGRGYIKPDSHVLDIGCGLGRVARPLTRHLTTGRYTGIDITKASTDWCALNYRDIPNFTFIHADLENSFYRPEGVTSAAAYKFPVESASIDFIWSTSVFTHMRLPEVDNYLGEMVRVAKPGALVWNTFFLLDYVSEPLARAGVPGGNRLQFPIEGGLCLSEEKPEHVIAFYTDRVTPLHRAHGLEIVHIGHGGWSGRPDAPGGGQDVILSRRI